MKRNGRLYVVTYDNHGNGREWGSKPQLTPEAAWQAAGWKEGETYLGAPLLLEEVPMWVESYRVDSCTGIPKVGSLHGPYTIQLVEVFEVPKSEEHPHSGGEVDITLYYC